MTRYGVDMIGYYIVCQCVQALLRTLPLTNTVNLKAKLSQYIALQYDIALGRY